MGNDISGIEFSLNVKDGYWLNLGQIMANLVYLHFFLRYRFQFLDLDCMCSNHSERDADRDDGP